MSKKKKDWNAVVKDKLALLGFVGLIAAVSIATGMLTG